MASEKNVKEKQEGNSAQKNKEEDKEKQEAEQRKKDAKEKNKEKPVNFFSSPKRVKFPEVIDGKVLTKDFLDAYFYFTTVYGKQFTKTIENNFYLPQSMVSNLPKQFKIIYIYHSLW